MGLEPPPSPKAIHAFVEPLYNPKRWRRISPCALCNHHRWYRLHQPDGKPISRSRFEYATPT